MGTWINNSVKITGSQEAIVAIKYDLQSKTSEDIWDFNNDCFRVDTDGSVEQQNERLARGWDFKYFESDTFLEYEFSTRSFVPWEACYNLSKKYKDLTFSIYCVSHGGQQHCHKIIHNGYPSYESYTCLSEHVYCPDCQTVVGYVDTSAELCPRCKQIVSLSSSGWMTVYPRGSIQKERDTQLIKELLAKIIDKASMKKTSAMNYYDNIINDSMSEFIAAIERCCPSEYTEVQMSEMYKNVAQKIRTIYRIWNGSNKYDDSRYANAKKKYIDQFIYSWSQSILDKCGIETTQVVSVDDSTDVADIDRHCCDETIKEESKEGERE